MTAIKLILFLIVFLSLFLIIGPGTENIIATNNDLAVDDIPKPLSNIIWIMSGFLSACLAVIITKTAVNSALNFDKEEDQD